MRMGLLIAGLAFQCGVVAQAHGQQSEQRPQLNGVRDEPVILTSQETPPSCIRAAATEGLIVAVGSFVVYKILGGFPLFGAPPSNRGSDAAAIVVFVAAGTAYAVWRAKKCEAEN